MNRPQANSATASFLLLPAMTAFSQEYPTTPVAIVVPRAAGGPTDTLMRRLGAAMRGPLKQMLITDIAEDAGGTIGCSRHPRARTA